MDFRVFINLFWTLVVALLDGMKILAIVRNTTKNSSNRSWNNVHQKSDSIWFYNENIMLTKAWYY